MATPRPVPDKAPAPLAPRTPQAQVRGRVVSGIKWLYPGMRVKRWLALIPIGLVPVLLGLILLVSLRWREFLDDADNSLRALLERFLHGALGDSNQRAVYAVLAVVLILLGLLIVLAAAIGVVRNIVGVVAPEDLTELSDVVYRKRALGQGPKIVVIGGGTGLSTLLRGLKKYTSNLTAVVTMTDDGGSSGLLQKQMGGILPPGDIRNCLVALADAEPLMQQLFQYRFDTGKTDDGLSGHSFGNLLIAAMADITGDFEKAVEETSSILAIRGRVLPSTVESVTLVGEMADGSEIKGETAIAHDTTAIEKIKLCPQEPRALPEGLAAIRDADIIVMGPGSVFTSVVPNLLVKEIAQAVHQSRAIKAYVCNVMTQPGESDGFSALDHVLAIEKHVVPVLGEGKRVFDYVLVNTARPTGEMMARYTNTGAELVNADLDAITARGYKAVKGSFISESAVVRHDPDKLAKSILRLWSERARWNK